MAKRTLILILGLCLISPLVAQKKLSWKKHVKAAEKELASRNYASAAEHYEQAWQQKRKKEELIFKAADIYYTIKDYRKAAESYQYVKDENEEFPLVGLKYARSLKQDGQYEKAKVAFEEFLNSYSGQGKSVLQDVIRKEVNGCDLATQLPLKANRDLELQFPRNLNSDANELSPAPHGNEMYFASNKGRKIRIYNALKAGETWGTTNTPDNFPIINNGHYSNPCFSPDGSKLYFTICDNDNSLDELKARCEIYFTTKSDQGWSEPQRLPDYINQKGVTATTPFVMEKGNEEILYFASNRDNGRGGLDIWYSTRNLNGGEFEFPVNLGSTVNTLGDELAPFFDQENNILYFSSNGHVTIGGFDIFQANGEKETWTTPQNIGLPVNSSADDYSYTQSMDGTSGYIVSNRVFGAEKASTRHTDIFEFALEGSSRIVLKGNVYDKGTGDLVDDFSVSLYQIEGADESLLFSRDFSNGNYAMDLLPGRRFRVEINSTGYTPGEYSFSTNDPNTNVYGQPLFLEAETAIGENEFGEPSRSDLLDENTGESYTARGTSPDDNAEYITSAPRYRGVYYKIQLAALRNYNPGRQLYQQLYNIGRLDTEKLVDRDLTRVLLADFFDKDEAFNMLETVKGLGFNTAFVVRYEDGERFGKIEE